MTCSPLLIIIHIILNQLLLTLLVPYSLHPTFHPLWNLLWLSKSHIRSPRSLLRSLIRCYENHVRYVYRNYISPIILNSSFFFPALLEDWIFRLGYWKPRFGTKGRKRVFFAPTLRLRDIFVDPRLLRGLSWTSNLQKKKRILFRLLYLRQTILDTGYWILAIGYWLLGY